MFARAVRDWMSRPLRPSLGPMADLKSCGVLQVFRLKSEGKNPRTLMRIPKKDRLSGVEMFCDFLKQLTHDK